MKSNQSKLTRIAISYDGNFFSHVSSYYKYAHEIGARISISGLHEFIRHRVAAVVGAESINFCPIVESHFFRGRFSAKVAEERSCLYNDRVFDDILMWEGVQVHYLPIKGNEERGVDIALSLDTYELAISGKVDMIVLIAGDRDYAPLVKKLLSVGVQVMVLGWNFEYKDDLGKIRQTFTSDALLLEATYPVHMEEIITQGIENNCPVTDNLFAKDFANNETKSENSEKVYTEAVEDDDDDVERFQGEIFSLGKGFGFIKSDDYTENVFFYWEELINKDFSEVRRGDIVTFAEGSNNRGLVAVKVKVIQSIQVI